MIAAVVIFAGYNVYQIKNYQGRLSNRQWWNTKNKQCTKLCTKFYSFDQGLYHYNRKRWTNGRSCRKKSFKEPFPTQLFKTAPQTLFVYNYDFQLLKILHTRIPMFRLAASGNNNIVYFIGVQEEFYIAKYNLDEWPHPKVNYKLWLSSYKL